MKLVAPGIVAFTLGFPSAVPRCAARSHADGCPGILRRGMPAHAYLTSTGRRRPGVYWPGCAPARSDAGPAPMRRVEAVVERDGRTVLLLDCGDVADARSDGPLAVDVTGTPMRCLRCWGRQRRGT